MTPSPVYVARAISDALAARARAAHSYLREWHDLAWARVPVEHIRAVLDVECRDEEPMRAARAWNGRGQLVLSGRVGTGKTYAAAQLVLEHVRAGGDACWVSGPGWALLDLDQQRAQLRLAEGRGLTVWDDIGAGVTKGEGFKARFEGLTMDRAARPSIVCSNANRAETAKFLGPRLLDRDTQHGEMHHFEGPSLRQPDEARPCQACTPKGRRTLLDCVKSQRWHDSMAIVGLLGVEERSVWDPEREALVVWLDVGRKLELEAGSNPGALLAMRRRFGLAQAEIVEAALELEANDPAAKAAEDYQRAKARLADKMRADTARLARDNARVLSELMTRRRRGPDPSTTILDDVRSTPWAEGAEGVHRLREQGYRVKVDGDHFELRRVPWAPTAKARAKAKGKVKGKDVSVLVARNKGCAADGWECARRLVSL